MPTPETEQQFETPISEQLRAALDRIAQLQASNPDAANVANLTERVNAAEAEVKSLRTQLSTAEVKVADLTARAEKADGLVANAQAVRDAENRAAAAESRQRVAEHQERSMGRRLSAAQWGVYTRERDKQLAAGCPQLEAEAVAKAAAFPDLAEIERLLGPARAAQSDVGREAAEVARLAAEKAKTAPAPEDVSSLSLTEQCLRAKSAQPAAK